MEKFRAAVVKYLVPVATEIYKEQAKRLGKEYPMSFADNALAFRSGNARLCRRQIGLLEYSVLEMVNHGTVRNERQRI